MFELMSLYLVKMRPSFTAKWVFQMVLDLQMLETEETWVQSLGREDSLEQEIAICSSILTWKIPWTVEPGRLQYMGPKRVEHDWVTEHTLTANYLVNEVLISLHFSSHLYKQPSLEHLHIWGYWYFSHQSWFQLVLLPTQHFSWCTSILNCFILPTMLPFKT